MFKKLILILLLIVVLIVVYLAGRGSSFPPRPAPTPTVSPLLVMSTRQLEPTFTPMATSTSTPMPPPPPTPIPTAARHSITIIPKCTPFGSYTQCYDPILDISFEYPAKWGIIFATLNSPTDINNNSGHIGHAYEYRFSLSLGESQLNRIRTGLAGGRSSDYSEPRGGDVTDFYGFGKVSTQVFCKNIPEPSICEVIKPGVAVGFLLPRAQDLCNTPSFMSSPIGSFLYINLPKQRLINGFVFVYPLLPTEQEASLYSILGIKHGVATEKCREAQLQDQFDQKINKLRNEILSRTGSDDILQSVNTLIRLANSIEGQETSK